MMTRIRKNQKGMAMVEYIIVLAVVASLALVLFGGNNQEGLRGALITQFNRAVGNINAVGQ